ncbi:hypothetical protein ABT104_19010 [Streptomyces mobaraensis]|uniref:hypothetical protein n=1 Tax=Streptomyces mobaraensis TaxID=35621 RepID=UPI00332ADC66
MPERSPGAHVVECVRPLPALAARFDLRGMATSYPLERHAEAPVDVAAGTVLKAVPTG